MVTKSQTRPTINEMRRYANAFLLDNYGMELEIPLQINGRLKKTYGRFRFYDLRKHGKKEPVMIDLNKYFYENNERDVILDVLKHELVHYAMFMQDKPFNDGHPVFENELKRLGVISQSNVKDHSINNKPSTVRVYECNDCGYNFIRKRRLPHGGINHRCPCGGSLCDKGEKTVKQ